MRSGATTTLIAVALGMLLAACVSTSAEKPVADKSEIARACPKSTGKDKLLAIALYLETAPESPGLDLLATEWERLNDGAKSCKAAAK